MSARHPADPNDPYPEPTRDPAWTAPVKCACVRDDALDCARARYRDAGDEPCECCCHDPDPDDET